MSNRILLVAIIAVLVALAGCADTGDVASDAAQPEQTEPTDDPSEEETEPTDVDSPNGSDESGVADANGAIDSHTSALIDANSFMIEYVFTVNAEEGKTLEFTETHTVDISEQRHYVRTENNMAVQEVYTEETHAWQRTLMGGEEQYRYHEQAFEVTSVTYEDFFDKFLTSVTYEQTDVSETDDGTLTTYEATGLVENGDLAQSYDEITDLDSTVTVDSDGIIRHFSFSGTIVNDGSEQVVTISLDFTDFTDVTVEKPGWLDEAKNETDSPESDDKNG